MIAAPPQAVSPDPGALWRRIVSIRGEMVWVVVGQTAAAAGGIVGVRLLTHWLPPAAYGQLALGLTLATLVQQSTLSPLTGSSLRFFSAAREAGELGSFLEALKNIVGTAAAWILVLLAVGMSAVAFQRQFDWIAIMGWCAVFAFFSSFSSMLDGMQNAARQRIVVAWHDGLGVWLRFLMGTAVVIMLGARAANALAGYAIAAVLVFGSQYYFFNRGLLPDKTDAPDPVRIAKWRQSIIAYSLPFMSWGVFVWAQSASERWALQFFGGASQVGLYAVLFQLGYYPITMLSGVATQLLSPMIFRIAGDGSDASQVNRCRHLAMKFASGALVVTVIFTGVAWLLSDFLFSLIVPPSYWAGAPLLPLMVLSSGIFASGQFACLGLLSGSSTKLMVRPKVATAIIAVAFNAAGAYLGGLKGVILASLVFSIVHTVWILALVSERSPREA